MEKEDDSLDEMALFRVDDDDGKFYYLLVFKMIIEVGISGD